MSMCSRVPVLRSSLHMRMVSAAHKNMSRTGIHSNRGRTSAMLRAKNDSTQKKMKNVVAVKLARNSQATGEEKNSNTSFCASLRPTRSRAIVVHLVKYRFQPLHHRSQLIEPGTGLDHTLGDIICGGIDVGVVVQRQCKAAAAILCGMLLY